MAHVDALKTSFMQKRSQMKSRFTTENYKSRWFVLTSEKLTYHDGSFDVSRIILIITLSILMYNCIVYVQLYCSWGYHVTICWEVLNLEQCHLKYYNFYLPVISQTEFCSRLVQTTKVVVWLRMYRFCTV